MDEAVGSIPTSSTQRVPDGAQQSRKYPLHAVAVAVDLGDAGEALDVAADIDARGLSPERHVRLQIDVARAHAQRRHTGEALAALLDAERLAPEHLHTHHLAKGTMRELLNQQGRRPTADLLDLARRSGVAP
jgi:hypothetical protein